MVGEHSKLEEKTIVEGMLSGGMSRPIYAKAWDGKVRKEDNTYWMSMMRLYTQHGIDFDQDFISTLDAISTDDVRQFVRDHIDTGNRLILTMTAQ